MVDWDQFRNVPGAAEIVARLIEECAGHMGGRAALKDRLYPEAVILAAMGAAGPIVDMLTIAERTRRLSGQSYSSARRIGNL